MNAYRPAGWSDERWEDYLETLEHDRRSDHLTTTHDDVEREARADAQNWEDRYGGGSWEGP